MSQSAAIAAVTLALRSRFEHAFGARVTEDRFLGDVLVTTMPVDRARSVHHRGQLNITLATVVESGAMRNAVGLGGRGTSTPAAQVVDLLYLLTAYGPEDDDIGAQRVMGAALRAVHEQPVLPPLVLADLVPNAGAAGTLDQVRLAQAPLTREQIVAWWLAFHTPYRLSAAVQVSGVAVG